MSKTKDIDDEITEIVVDNKSGFNLVEVIAIVIISILFGVIIGSAICTSKESTHNVKLSHELQEFITIYNNINDNYYGNISEKKLVNSAIKGMVKSLDDPYSDYMDNSQTEQFDELVDGSYVGIGATIGQKDNRNYIVSLFKNSPAKNSGLKVGDIFVKIDGKDVINMDVHKLSDLVKGEASTSVEITVLRGEEYITKTVVRNSINIPSVASKIYKKNNQKVGYIYISTFAANTYNQFESELKKLEKKKIDSLIIDVRSNPGGYLSQVTKILDLFMDKKKVLYQVEIKGKKIKKYSETSNYRKYMVSVITNSASASASEILAAAFKDSYDKSFLVGTKTYGKGTVQKAYHLSSGSSFKYTTEKWLTPSGDWIDKVGVSPDYEVNFSDKYKENPSDDNDDQLQKAIQLLTEKES